MIAAAVLSLVLQAAPVPSAQAAPPPTAQTAQQRRLLMLFLFYRLRYFHDAAERRGCLRTEPGRTAALNARYDSVRRRVVELAGAEAADQRSPHNRDDPDEDRRCDIGVPLWGYANALAEIERHLEGGSR